MSKVYLGMAMQAFSVAAIMKTEMINVTPGQQVVAGAIFLVMSLIPLLEVEK